MIGPFRAAGVKGEQWGQAAKACLDQLGGRDENETIGFLYASGQLGRNLPSILTFLRETTRIPAWVGAAMPGMYLGNEEIGPEGGLAVMTGRLPSGSFCLFAAENEDEFAERTGPWLAANPAGLGLIHGNPADLDLARLIGVIADSGIAPVGGLAQPGPSHIAGQPLLARLSGMLLSSSVPVITGHAPGCTLIGATHEVTGAEGGLLAGLDGRPALDVLKEEAGELIARNLRRAAGFIHVGVQGKDGQGFAVRDLLGIDASRGRLAVAGSLKAGTRISFMRKDANDAQFNLHFMLGEIRQALAGRVPAAAIYIACVARGKRMFGEAGAEMALVQDALGSETPLIALRANGEISGSLLTSYSGVLTVILK